MGFEYDPNKSKLNKRKHGIDFEEAQLLWMDTKRIIIDARTVGEQRKLLIAAINKELWSAVFTLRNKKIRIISVRKARKKNSREY